MLIVSENLFNQSGAELVIVVPLTTADKRIPYHVKLGPPEGGLRQTCFAKCEDVRSISRERLNDRRGDVSQQTMAQVERRLRLLLRLD